MEADERNVKGQLAVGVTLDPLERQLDHRGALTEIFRATSSPDHAMVQWNAVTSAANVLRGVHCHRRHHDVIVVVQGRAVIGMQDLRPRSRTVGAAAVVEVDGDQPTSIAIPPGVAHGFYFPEPALHVYGVSAYWDPADELGCHWSDPGLHIPWPDIDPILSERDVTAGSLNDLERALAGPDAG